MTGSQSATAAAAQVPSESPDDLRLLATVSPITASDPAPAISSTFVDQQQGDDGGRIDVPRGRIAIPRGL